MIELTELQANLWCLRLNRPDKANALTTTMLEQLLGALEQIQGAQARALVLTGAGKVFSAGADLAEAHNGLATSPLWEELSAALAKLPMLKICALNGTVAGGATGMALACDIRIASPQAKFFYPVLAHGFMPQPSDVARMRALIGPARSKLILSCAQTLSAEEALDVGLYDRVVPVEGLLDAAQTLAQASLAAKPELATAILALCDGRQ